MYANGTDIVFAGLIVHKKSAICEYLIKKIRVE